MILPIPLRSWGYAKVAGSAAIALPSAGYFCLGAAMAPAAFGDALESLLTNAFGWYMLAFVVLGLHLTVFLSLRVRRGALPLAVLIVFLGNMLVMVMLAGTHSANGAEACAGVLAFFVFALSLALHPVIGRLVTEKAAE